MNIWHLAPRVELSRATTHSLLRELNFKPYRLSVCQELKAGDYGWRVVYCRWLEQFAHGGASRFDNVYFSDEAWVHLDSYINSQNYRIWCCKNSHAFVESGLHPLKIGIWCGVYREEKLLARYFLNNPSTRHGIRALFTISSLIWRLMNVIAGCNNMGRLPIHKKTQWRFLAVFSMIGSLLEIIGLHAVRTCQLATFFCGAA